MNVNACDTRSLLCRGRGQAKREVACLFRGVVFPNQVEIAQNGEHTLVVKATDTLGLFNQQAVSVHVGTTSSVGNISPPGEVTGGCNTNGSSKGLLVSLGLIGAGDQVAGTEGYEYITAVSPDRMTLFVKPRDKFLMVALARKSVKEPFVNSNAPLSPPVLPGFRTRPFNDCRMVIATVSPGGCAEPGQRVLLGQEIDVELGCVTRGVR